MTFGHVLFPVDFSQRSIAAAQHVREMVRHFDSTLTLISVVDVMRTVAMSGEFGVPYGYGWGAESLEKQTRLQLDDFGKDHFPNVRREICVQEGDPAVSIVSFAQERAVDLIMMPSHGYGPFRSLLLGSVTAKVLHDAECPVWTDAHLDTMTEEIRLPCRNVLCAIDLSPRSTALIQWASHLAQSFNATLRLVHAIPAVLPLAEIPEDARFAEEVQQDARRRIADLQKEAGTNAPVCVAIGHPGEAVADEARRHVSDLVVIGRGCLQQRLGRLRTHAYSIIRQSPCPVISV